jgi:hypothetical protein
MQTQFVLDNVPNAYKRKLKYEVYLVVCEQSDNKQTNNDKNIQRLGKNYNTSPTHVGWGL